MPLRSIFEVPAPRLLLESATAFAVSTFGSETLTLAEMNGWWSKNIYVTGILHDGHSEPRGYFDVVPLTDAGLEAFESGRIGEREISSPLVLPPEQMRCANTLYMAGINVKAAGTEEGRFRTAELLQAFVAYMRLYYGTKPRRMIGITVTEAGARFVGTLDAKLVCIGSKRRDHHDLYEFTVTKTLLDRIGARARKRAPPPLLVLRADPASLFGDKE